MNQNTQNTTQLLELLQRWVWGGGGELKKKKPKGGGGGIFFGKKKPKKKEMIKKMGWGGGGGGIQIKQTCNGRSMDIFWNNIS